MATWNPAHRSETGDLIRLLPCVVSLLVAVSCVSSAAAPSAEASPTITRFDVALPSLTPSAIDAPRQPDAAGAGDAIWRFAGTLLPPSDPNSYANVILDIEPLKDGGVVVAEGSGTRGLDLQTLDTLWTTDAECVAVADRGYAYQPFTMSPPGTFEERDARTFSLIRSLPHIKVGQLTTPMILSNWNLAVVGSKSSDHWFDFFALDPGSPIKLPWIDRLRGARSIGLLSGDRAIV